MVRFYKFFSKIFNNWQLLRFISFIIVASSAVSFFTQACDIQNKFVKSNMIDNKNIFINISAEKITGILDQQINLDRNIQIIRDKTIIKADKAEYRINKNEIKATGNIWMKHFQNYYTGDIVIINLDTNKGHVINPRYLFTYNGGHGIANRIDFVSDHQIIVNNGIYSTCENPNKEWYIRASTFNFDKKNDTSFINKGMIYFKNIPIFRAPLISFSLSKQRKLGLLPPIFGITNNGGPELTVPYYFNTASNQDWTIYSKYIFKRGLHLKLHGDYHSQMYVGKTTLEGIKDQITHKKRYLFSSIHTQTLIPQLILSWNVNKTSDNHYLNDFSHIITNNTQNLLTRNVNLTYNSIYWTMNGSITKYQLLQDINNLIQKPYDRTLQLTFNIKRKNLNGFNINLMSEFARFSNVYTTGSNVGNDMIGGYRTYSTSSISYPIIHSGYFIIPKIILDITAYYLNRAKLDEKLTLTRVIPIYSLDTGIVAERETYFFGQHIIQTLEPRLFYVRTPYKNQSNFPNFDSSTADFNFAQIFAENYFIGHDRISDANQVTSVMISRFIEKNGLERLRLAIGQIFYFNEPKVILDDINSIINNRKSNLLLSLSGRITNEIFLDNTIQYNENLKKLIRSNLSIHWQLTPKKILNITYRFNHNNDSLKQIDISAQWPILQHWYLISRINYTIPKKIISGSLLGIEYKNNCWISRFITQRISIASHKTSTSFLVQFELNGFSKINSNLLDIFHKNISGY